MDGRDGRLGLYRLSSSKLKITRVRRLRTVFSTLTRAFYVAVRRINKILELNSDRSDVYKPNRLNALMARYKCRV